MKKLIKRTIAMLVGMVVFFTTAIGNSGLVVNAADSDTLVTEYGTVWSAPSTVKIPQDATDYANKQGALLSYQAVRNEYESAQLLVSATTNVDSFELRTANLMNGTNKLSKKNFQIYVQKYVSVTDSYGTVKMPDALLPMETAASYGENAIAEGQNGALWATVYIPQDTPAGTYSGTFQLVLNGSLGEMTMDIPVSVVVYDYTLSGELTTKSLFAWRYNEIAVGELDGSVEMMETYYDFFKEYRVSLHSLPMETLSAQELVDVLDKNWAEISTYALVEDEGTAGMTLYNAEAKLREQIYALAKASTAERNLFEKAVIYDIDEPDLSNESTRKSMIAKTNQISAVFETCVNVIQKDTKGTYAELKQIENWQESILGIPKIVTLPEDSVEWLLENRDTTEAQTLLDAMNCFCVKFEDDATMQGLASLLKTNDIELWWYTCNYPLAPYGNFDIGDDNLLSARSFAWYQDKYDVKGLLYWSAAGYTSAVDGEYLNLYENANRYHTNPFAPAGDGYLTYPGKPYEVYGPISSLRLMSIRDGQEEYELLQVAKESMVEETYETWMADIYASLGTGTDNLYQDGENGLDFATLRAELLEVVSGIKDPLDKDPTYEGGGNGQDFDDLFGESTETESDTGTEPEESLEQEPSYEDGGNGQEYEDLFDQSTETPDDSTPADPNETEEGTELLMAFESYDEITGAGLCVSRLFGKTVINGDKTFVTQGNSSWLIQPQGDYGTEQEYPSFRMRCFTSNRDTTFRTDDFSAYDKVMLDVYNDSAEAVQIEWKFTMQNAFGKEVNSGKHIYTLAPNQWTTCEYDLSSEEFYTALDLTQVKYMTVTLLTEKESKEDSVSNVYFDNLRGHLSELEYAKQDFATKWDSDISFENALERYLISENRAGNNAMELSRVTYEESGIASLSEDMGDYVLKGEVKGATWPAFTVHYNEELPAGTIVSFKLYVAGDKSLVSGQTYHVECPSHKIAYRKYEFNQWVNVEIELSEAATSSWLFLNFDNGLGASKFQRNPIQVYMDGFAIQDEMKGDNYYLDISPYRAKGTYTYPKKTGYVFGGWYQDSAYSVPVDASVKTGPAYAKFVDEKVLDIKAQLSGDNSSVKRDIRFVTTVDSINYQKVGFQVAYDIDGDGIRSMNKITSDKVYSSLYYIGATDGQVMEYYPEKEFCNASKYFKAVTVKNVPESHYDMEFKVIPFWTTLDGTTVKADARTMSINDGVVDYKAGVTFEKPVEQTQFKKLNSQISIVDYAKTSIGSQDSEYGTYAMKFNATGLRYPYTSVNLGETCNGNVARLCFKIYVEADETLAADQVFYVGNDDGTAHKFNEWTEGFVKVKDGTDTLSFFLNFDKAITALGSDFSMTVYMDNFYWAEGDFTETVTFENDAEKYLFSRNSIDYSFETFDGTTALTYVVNQNWPYVNFVMNQSYEEDKILYFKIYAKVDESLVTDEIFWVGNDDPNQHPFNQWTEGFIKIKAGSSKSSVWLNFESALQTIGYDNITVYLDDFEIR